MPFIPPLPILPSDPAERRRVYLQERHRLCRLEAEYGRAAIFYGWLCVAFFGVTAVAGAMSYFSN